MQDRFDLYGPPHKGIRNAMQASLIGLGQLDPSDPSDVAQKLADLRDLLRWCEAHLAIEERFVHQAIDRRRPGAALSRVRGDHAGHERMVALLRQDAEALERSLEAAAPVREARARQLYLGFSQFVGENFIHMAFEETEINAVLWELFTNDELRAIQASIVGSESPEQLMRGVRWLLPALAPDERVAMIASSRPGIPEPVFQQLLGALQGYLSAVDYAKLLQAVARP